VDWYVHSFDRRTRKNVRSGPFETQERAVEFASREWKVMHKPLLVEGPDGEKIEGQQLQDRIQRIYDSEL
jgi:hypothetical protein